MILDFDGATLDQYDAVIERLGLTPGGKGEPGGLFHWMAPTAGGIRIFDVWETQEAFETHAAEKVAPAAAAVGVTAPPRVEILPVHNHLSAG